jgi:hypothetical protein
MPADTAGVMRSGNVDHGGRAVSWSQVQATEPGGATSGAEVDRSPDLEPSTTDPKLCPGYGTDRSRPARSASGWSRLKSTVAILALGVAAAGPILGVAAGTAHGQGLDRSAIETRSDGSRPAIETRSDGSRPTIEGRHLPPWLGAVLGRTVTFTWNQDLHRNKDHQPFPPGRGVDGFIIEERDASTGNYDAKDIGRASCLDSGALATCTYQLPNVPFGYHVYRVRAYQNDPASPNGKAVSDPSPAVGKFILP